MRYSYECSFELKALPETLNNTSLIKAKPLELCVPCLLVLKVAVSFYGEIVNFMSDPLYSIVKVATKPFHVNQKGCFTK